MSSHDLIVALLILLMAMLYSSVGHAGSSGFQAAMGLMGVSAAFMRPTALLLNILVATIGTIRFARAGCFSWRLFWPFALGSLPLALIGGGWKLTEGVYFKLVGIVLLFAAYRLFLQTMPRARATAAAAGLRPINQPVAVGCGAFVGLLSGLTSTGGGIFLSPMLRLMRWADMRHTAGVSVAFILVTSISGLIGQMKHELQWPAALPYWAAAAVIGGLIGSELGSRRLNNATLTRLLSLVLVIAGGKLLMMNPASKAGAASQAAVSRVASPR